MMSKPTLFFIPGGPGLSSYSFSKLKPLEEVANLVFFNPMGTNGQNQVIEKPSYQDLTDEVIQSIKSHENVILCGHSFGGIQAIDIATKSLTNVIGLIAIAAPVSESSFHTLRSTFNEVTNDAKKEATEELANSPTKETYKNWHKAYHEMYVHEPENISVITNDKVSISNYLGATNESPQQQHVINDLKHINLPKLFISGELDKVMPAESVKVEVAKGNLELKTINDSGHFVQYEQPQKTMMVITEFINKHFKEGLK